VRVWRTSVTAQVHGTLSASPKYAASRSGFAGHSERSAPIRNAPRWKPDHPVGAGRTQILISRFLQTSIRRMWLPSLSGLRGGQLAYMGLAQSRNPLFQMRQDLPVRRRTRGNRQIPALTINEVGAEASRMDFAPSCRSIALSANGGSRSSCSGIRLSCHRERSVPLWITSDTRNRSASKRNVQRF
jgi:hypothetical protein